ELETQVLHRRAGSTRTGGRGADVTKAAVKDAVGLAEPVGDADIGALGRAAERVTLDLIDGELAAEAAGDRLHELGQDLLRVVLLGTGDERGVPRDVRHDEEPSHRRDGTSARRLGSLATR